MYYPQTLVVLDVETTGVDASKDTIIEVAACKYQDGKIIDTFETLTYYGGDIPEVVQFLTGIDPGEVKKAPKFDEIREKLADFIADHPIVGHNIQFDIAFLKSHGIEVNQKSIDTYALGGIVLSKPRSYSLESLAHDLDIEHREKHRALGDVEATADLFQILWEKTCSFSKEMLQTLCEIMNRSESDLRDFFKHAYSEVSTNGSNKKEESIKDSKQHENIEDWLHDPHSPFFDRTNDVKSKAEEFDSTLANLLVSSKNFLCEMDRSVDRRLFLYLSLLRSGKRMVYVSSNYQDFDVWKDFGDFYDASTARENSVAHFGNHNQYFCRERYELMLKKESFSDNEAHILAKITLWLDTTKTGAVSELGFIRGEYLMFHALFSSHHSCLKHSSCYLKTSWDHSENAQVLLMHPRAFILASKNQSSALADREVFCLDDIEHFENTFRYHLDTHVNDQGAQLLITALRETLASLNKDTELLESFDQALANYWMLVSLFMRPHVDPGYQIGKLVINEEVLESEEFKNLHTSSEELIHAWGNCKQKLSEDVQSLENTDITEVVKSLIDDFDMWFEKMKIFFDPPEGQFSYLEQTSQDDLILHTQPRDLSAVFTENIIDKYKQTIALTTIHAANGNHLVDQTLHDYLHGVFGMKEFEVAKCPMQNPAWEDMKVIMPEDIPLPNANNYLNSFTSAVRDFIHTLRGEVIGALNSIASNQEVHKALSVECRQKGIQLIAQAISGGKGKVLQAYERSPEDTVLLGTTHFWQHTQITDTKVKGMIVQKIPFDYPDDPLLKIYSSQFKNVFGEYSLPRSLFRFKRMVDILLQNEGEKKVLLLPDKRLLEKSYGKNFLELFPQENIIYCKTAEISEVLSGL